MDLLISILLSFIELTFIVLVTLFLFNQRERIGRESFLLGIGAVFVFLQFIFTTEMKVISDIKGFDFYISNLVLFHLILAIIILVYISEGVLAAQRLIIGTVIAFIIFIYISCATVIQSSWDIFSIAHGTSTNTIEYVLTKSLRSMFATIVGFSIDLLLIPVIFQKTKNLVFNRFISIFTITLNL